MFQVEVARLPERPQLIAALEAHGLTARPLGEAGIEVACEDCETLLHELDAWIAERDLPLVPFRADDMILLRPPTD
jgi:hypothetical protein